jgi:hypothetical protein
MVERVAPQCYASRFELGYHFESDVLSCDG